MSKIEEALEKAKQLRGAPTAKAPVLLKRINEEIEPIEVNNPYVISITQPDSPVVEEYKKLKSIVIRETKSNFLNTIMITSAIDNEGKTLTAINFAISLAQEIDHSILLIDADIRKPKIHKYLGIKPEHGLSDYLTRDMDVSEILIKTVIGNLVFPLVANESKNPAELLASKKMKS